MVVATGFAFLQKPHQLPFKPVPLLSVRGFLLPIEFNSYRLGIEASAQRTKSGIYREAAVFGTPDGGRFWMITRDYVLSSNDGGDSWVLRNVPPEGFRAESDEALRTSDAVVESLSRQAAIPEVATDNKRAADERTIGTSSSTTEASPRPSGTFHLRAMAFDDSGRIGIAAGGDGYIIERTGDGGATWQVVAGHANPYGRLTSSHPVQQLLDVALSANGRVGVAVGTYGVVTTTNDGETWSFDWLDRTYYKLRGVAISADGQLQILIGDLTDPNQETTGVILLSNDSGKTWRETTRPGESLKAVAMSRQGKRIIIVGSAGKQGVILEPSNDGVEWQAAFTLEEVRFNDIALAKDGSTAIAVGERGDVGVMVRNIGAGSDWSEVPIQQGHAVAHLTSVFMTGDGKVALTTAADGRILVSHDQGLVWRQAHAYWRLPAPWYFCVVALCVVLLVAMFRQPNVVVPKEVGSADHYANDAPIHRQTEDRLNVRPLAEGISHFLRNPSTRPPLTVAITGPWGSGKSSIMNMLAEDLQAYDFQTVRFNAWHHQTEASLLAALLEAVQQQGIPRPWQLVGLLFRAKLYWARIVRMVKRGPALAAALVGVAIATAWLSLDSHVLSQLAQDLGSKLGLPEGFGELLLRLGGGILIPAAFLTWVMRQASSIGFDTAKLVASIGTRMRIRDLRDQLAVRDRFAEEFADVTDALRPWSTLVLVIDDLDRCRPERVMEILECINFLTVAGSCFVVMGLDMGPVLCAVQMSFDATAKRMAEIALTDSTSESARVDYADATAFARHYIEKLVNIQVPVPPLDRRKIPNLIRSSADDDESDEASPVGAPASYSSVRSGAWIRHAWRVTGIVVPVGVLLLLSTLVGTYFGAQLDAVSKQIIGGVAVEETDTGVQGRQRPSDPDDLFESATKTFVLPPWYVRLRQTPPLAYIVAVGSLVLGALAIFWMQAWRSFRPEDDDLFRSAVLRWGAIFDEVHATPRAFKQYQNRVRFLAMRQARGREGIVGIPEPMLVALGALYEHKRVLIDPSIFYKVFDSKTGTLVDPAPIFGGEPPRAVAQGLAHAVDEQIRSRIGLRGRSQRTWPPSRRQLAAFSYMVSGFYNLGARHQASGQAPVAASAAALQ
jgi:hypothetical protein